MTKNRTEYHRMWRAENREKVRAARERYRAAHPYVSRVKSGDLTGRLITVRQEQVYRLVHPDFYNLPYWAAGLLLGVCAATICNELKRMKKACPSLFPLYPKCPENMKCGFNRPAIHYKKWMDFLIVEKF